MWCSVNGCARSCSGRQHRLLHGSPSSLSPVSFADADESRPALPESLETIPKADYLPTQRHRWNTNEVYVLSFPFFRPIYTDMRRRLRFPCLPCHPRFLYLLYRPGPHFPGLILLLFLVSFLHRRSLLLVAVAVADCLDVTLRATVQRLRRCSCP